MKKSLQDKRNRFKMLEAAPSITASGPSGSGKSLMLMMMQPAFVNRLFSGNVGDNQTTLIRTRLMLDATMNDNEILVRVKIKPLDYVLILTHVSDVILETIYEARDDLEEFTVPEDTEHSLLNPRDQAYHFADYVGKCKAGCPTKDELHDLLAKLIDALIPNLRDAVREKEKETKTAYPKPKKKEIYEMVIQERLTNFDLAAPMNNVVDWFERLHSFIQNEIMENCEWLYDDQIYAVIDGIIDDNKNATTSHEMIENPIEALIRSTYDKKSAYSLVLDELAYCVRPSAAFLSSFEANFHQEASLGKVLRLNILDTPGLTQTGESLDVMQDTMQRNLGLKTDAFLFLCGADARKTVYDNFKVLLNQKEIKEKMNGLPVKILRTRADFRVYSRMKEICMEAEGDLSLLKENAVKYAKKAFDELVKENEEDSKEWTHILGINTQLELISLDSVQLESLVGNVMKEMKLTNKFLYDALFDIVRQVNESHMPDSKGLRYLQVKDIAKPALTIKMNTDVEVMLNLFGETMVALNARDSQNNYFQYESKRKTYHGRSVYTHKRKLEYGSGHETRAVIYENFVLHLRSMVQKWLSVFFTNRALNLQISFDNIADSESKRQAEKEAADVLMEVFLKHLPQIYFRMAKWFTYEGMRTEVEDIYKTEWAADPAFRKHMRIIMTKFSNREYWSRGLEYQIKLELNQLLNRMYFFE